LIAAKTAPPSALLTVAEVGEIIRAKEPKVRALCRGRRLSYVRSGKNLLFTAADVADYIERNRVEAIDRDRDRARGRGARAVAGLLK